MNKLSPLGIGPKIGIIAIPYVIIAILLTVFYPEIFSFGPVLKMPFRIAGFVILAIGLIFYIATAKALLTGLRHNKLMTTGPYKYSQNPLYAVMILLIIPGLALVLNSWIILTGCIVAYLIFKMKIHTEYEEMERIFGDEYLEYRKRTPEFFLF
jgi:protein-S-isoprenylcysteine O-methyltransferase Ste14